MYLALIDSTQYPRLQPRPRLRAPWSVALCSAGTTALPSTWYGVYVHVDVYLSWNSLFIYEIRCTKTLEQKLYICKIQCI